MYVVHIDIEQRLPAGKLLLKGVPHLRLTSPGYKVCVWRDTNEKEENSPPSLGLTMGIILMIFKGSLYLNLGNL